MMRFAPLASERTGVRAADSTLPPASAIDEATPAMRDGAEAVASVSDGSPSSFFEEVTAVSVGRDTQPVTCRLDHAPCDDLSSVGGKAVNDNICPWCETSLVLRLVADE